MKSNEKILVATFGIKESERRLMQTICLVSKGRRRAYELLGDNAREAPDIVIADGDNPRAIAAWLRFKSSYPMVPGIIVARSPAKDSEDLQVVRPIKATSLLEVLDRTSVGRENLASAPLGSEDMAKQTSDVPPQRREIPVRADRRRLTLGSGG